MKHLAALLICLTIPSLLFASIHGDKYDVYEAHEIFDNLEFTAWNKDKLTELDVEMVEKSIQATAAMMHESRIVETDGISQITGSPLRNYIFYSTGKPLCRNHKNVRYLDQIASATCSGALISPQHILTAGHCITNMSDCKSYKWLFDYKYHEGTSDILLSEEQIYKCVAIEGRKYDAAKGFDYAIIKLDREVIGRTPLKTRKMGTEKYFVTTVDPKTGEEVEKLKRSRVDKGVPLFTIGFPFGTPMKVTTNGKIVDQGLTYAFRSNLDNFMGNSGGPVINATTGIIEGVISIVAGRGLVDGPKEADGTKCFIPREVSEIPNTSHRPGLFIQSTRVNNQEILDTIRTKVTNNE